MEAPNPNISSLRSEKNRIMKVNPNIWTLRSETNRIIEAHCGHLLTLSFIFLLPLSSFILLYPLLYFKLLNHSYSPYQPIIINPYTHFLYLLHSLFVMFFSFCGVSSITYGVFHGFYDEPLNLKSSIKSISTSFFPLLATTIVLKLIFLFINFFFSLLLIFLLILGTQLLGVKLTLYFFAFCAALVLIPMLVLVSYLQVKWSLVPVIVVMEKCWGLEPLRRSSSLIKGMKGVALTLLLFFGFFEGMLVWFHVIWSLAIMKGSPKGILMKFDWMNILLLIAGKSLLLMLLLFINTVANTVLYIFCKGIHGEHANMSRKDYVKLKFDENV
ncbi:hypothetical protein RIF29_35527 [Crotalaria pallida]|uniref:Transmembrane protein n=1 Tax=Crotalaria pallida TaxID=3830 RepID=A0AAN9HRR9_CROPI